MSKHGLDDVAPKIEQSIKPSLLLRHVDPIAANEAVRSKLGGLPDLPSPDLWPRRGTKVLEFIGQIALDETSGQDVSGLLPKSGLLSFFYDVGQQPWGHSTDERTGWRVLYSEASQPTKRVEPPKVKIYNAEILPEIKIQFESSLTIPTFRSIERDPLELTDAQADRYFDMRHEWDQNVAGDTPLHRLLGHPDGVQGCMQRTAQFASRDLQLPEGMYSYYEHPRAAELIPGAHDWQLLLQIDSDEQLKQMWGDCGRIYFWIHREALRQKDFSKCWLFLQCG